MSPTYDVAVVGLGALGSATAWQLARRGRRVVGFEQFELGHERGASHDTSRILRHSYHTADYVRLTMEAYQDWADLEDASDTALVTVTGGVDLYPPDAAIPRGDYVASMAEVGVPFEVLGTSEVHDRWPQWRLPEGTVAVHQERTAVVPAALGTTTMQRLARDAGANLLERSAVAAVRPRADGVEVVADGTTYSCAAAVVCADAWAGRLLAPLGWDLPLTVTEEQVTYFAPEVPETFAGDRFPVWIWMDDPSYYGFPTYGEPTVKAAQDCGGPVVTPENRSGHVDASMLADLAAFMVGPVPGAERVVVGLGAAHGFKFAPTFGRRLADLAQGDEPGPELAPFRLDRPALTEPDVEPSWLV